MRMIILIPVFLLSFHSSKSQVVPLDTLSRMVFADDINRIKRTVLLYGYSLNTIDSTRMSNEMYIFYVFSKYNEAIKASEELSFYRKSGLTKGGSTPVFNVYYFSNSMAIYEYYKDGLMRNPKSILLVNNIKDSCENYIYRRLTIDYKFSNCKLGKSKSSYSLNIAYNKFGNIKYD